MRAEVSSRAPRIACIPRGIDVIVCAVEGIARRRGLARPSIVDVVVVPPPALNPFVVPKRGGSLVRTTWIQRTLSPDGSLPCGW